MRLLAGEVQMCRLFINALPFYSFLGARANTAAVKMFYIMYEE